MPRPTDVDAPSVPAPVQRPMRARVLRLPSSLRMRILALVVGLLALTTTLFVAVTSTVLDIRLENRIDADSSRRRPSSGGWRTGATREPAGPSAPSDAIFDVYFERNVPSRNEALIAIVGGKPYLRSQPVVPYRLDRDTELVAHWASLRQPTRGGADTPAGHVDYLALPVAGRGRVGDVYVAAFFRDRLQSDYDATVLAAGATGLSVLLVGSPLAWRLAGRVVDPVTRLTTAARSISDTDLTGASRSRAATRSRSRLRRSTRCSTGSSVRSSRSASSSTTPATNCARR